MYHVDKITIGRDCHSSWKRRSIRLNKICGESPASFSLDLDDQIIRPSKCPHYVIVDKGVVFDDYRLRNMTEENPEELLKSNSCSPFEEWSKSGFTTNYLEESTKTTNKSFSKKSK